MTKVQKTIFSVLTEQSNSNSLNLINISKFRVWLTLKKTLGPFLNLGYLPVLTGCKTSAALSLWLSDSSPYDPPYDFNR